jgi:hypothetical protein
MKLSVIRTVGLTALVVAIGSGVASATEVTGARVVGLGVYKCAASSGTQSAPGTPGNDIDLFNGCQLSLASSTIQARLGTQFGCTFVVDGSPADADVALNLRWKFPSQGLRDRSGGKDYYWADYVRSSKVGQPHSFFYGFDHAWELVPGEWALEIRDGSRKLTECRFNVVSP